MQAINNEWFKHPYLNMAYKHRGNAQWQGYQQATGGGFNRGGIEGPVELPVGMELWKLSQNPVGLGDQKLSEWWCSRKPYRQQNGDLKRCVEEAALNGVPLHVYIRVASCVKINWNTLDNLQIIRLKYPVKALWGKFAPMNLMEAKNPKYWTDKNDRRLAGMKKAGYDPAAGDAVLGGMNSYQLFIPGLLGNHVQMLGECDSQDNSAIKNLLGIRDLPKGPQDLSWRRS